MGDRGWRLWPYVCLRGAGFPATLALDLAIRDLDALLEAADAARTEEVRAREAAIAIVREATRTAEDADLRKLRSTLKKLRAGRAPVDDDAAGAFADLVRLRARIEETDRALGDHIREELRRIRHALRHRLDDPRFREALVWQNRRLLKTAVEPLLRRPLEADDSATRQHELTLSSYLLRFTTKNDSIGFFGPVGWGELSARSAGFTFRAGPRLLAKRSVYFERWAIAAIAAKIADDPALRPWLIPRRAPTLRIDGPTLHLPSGGRIILPPHQTSVLAACDGERTAQAIAHALGPELSESEVVAILEGLASKKLITWTLEVPLQPVPHEAVLASLAARIEDDEARARIDGIIADLGAQKRAIEDARGDPVLLDGAFDRMEAWFTSTTGHEAQRRPGEAYAGRTTVYEDCRRDVTLEIGEAVLAPIQRPLELLLQSARWYTQALAARYRKLCRSAFDSIASERGQREVDYLRFWERVAPHFAAGEDGVPSIVEETRRELARRWGSVLDIDAAARIAAFDSGKIAAAVDRVFWAPCPGWPSARHHSPDILIAAESAEAIARGEYRAILGELHVGMSTMSAPFFLEQHPSPREIIRMREREIEPCLRLVPNAAAFNRAAYLSLSSGDVDLETGAMRSWRPRANVAAIADLVVEEREGSLVVRTRDGRRSFELMACLDDALTLYGFAHFEVIRTERHSPRVMIDRLVIARERWRFDPDEIGFLHPSLNGNVMAAIRWARAFEIPRFVFVKTPEEPKPFYVDFHAPLSVDAFARAARRATSVLVSEMLPGHTEMWLTDGAGERYASELRFTAVDPVSYDAALARRFNLDGASSGT